MHQVQIHDAFAGATPTQVSQALAHRLRLARMASPLNLAVAPPVTPVTPVGNPSTRFWFHIVEEIDAKDPPIPSIRSIQDAVCEHYLVARNDLVSPRRDPSIVIPRQVAMHLSRKLTQYSYSLIGVKFAKDHSTVMYGFRKIERLLATNPAFGADIAKITETIQAKWGD